MRLDAIQALEGLGSGRLVTLIDPNGFEERLVHGIRTSLPTMAYRRLLTTSRASASGSARTRSGVSPVRQALSSWTCRPPRPELHGKCDVARRRAGERPAVMFITFPTIRRPRSSASFPRRWRRMGPPQAHMLRAAILARARGSRHGPKMRQLSCMRRFRETLARSLA
jgi:hypothetical protein